MGWELRDNRWGGGYNLTTVSHLQRNGDGQIRTTAPYLSPAEERPIKEAAPPQHIRCGICVGGDDGVPPGG